jgi:hypothetical protein
MKQSSNLESFLRLKHRIWTQSTPSTPSTLSTLSTLSTPSTLGCVHVSVFKQAASPTLRTASAFGNLFSWNTLKIMAVILYYEKSIFFWERFCNIGLLI